MLPPELRKKLVSDIVTAWEFKNPGAMRNAYKEVKMTRSTRANKFAELAGKDDIDLRLMVRLPLGLWRMFDAILTDPRIFHDKEELIWFMKTYPGYRVPEKL